MPRAIRFHLDEHCDPAIAVGLRRQGIKVTTTADANLLRASDEEHAAYGLSAGRVIFTQNRDFLRMHAAGMEHAGLAYCRQQSLTISEIINGLTLLWEILEPNEMHNRVEFL